MDGRDFDALTRSLAAGASRRGVLRAGLALASAALGLGTINRAKARRTLPVGSPCIRDSACSSGSCGPADARGRRRCQCASVADCPAPANSCAVVTCAAGVCVQEITVGVTCASGNLCLTGETCQADGTCGGGSAVNCDDGNACTVDTCDPAVGCVHTAKQCPAPASLCEVATCNPQTGECGIANKDCNDNYTCTKDSCDLSTGRCVNTYVVSDRCPPRIACGSTADCTSSTDPCAVMECVAGGCQPAFLPVGTPCSSGDPCLANETCQANSTCGGGVEVACT